MKKLLGLFVGVLSFFVLFNTNKVFACPEGCSTCHHEQNPETYIVEEVCDDPAPGSSGEAPELCPEGCCGIRLNTDFPIIGKCISIGSDSKTNVTNAFPYMVGAITKIVMSLILVVCFIFVIYAGILRSSDKPKEAKPILEKVAITILLLGFSGVILKLINPNFFG